VRVRYRSDTGSAASSAARWERGTLVMKVRAMKVRAMAARAMMPMVV
jgi:hypothetical protein